jgi:hypothetical protein
MKNPGDTSPQDKAGDRLQADLERLACLLDQQRFAGRAWSGPPMQASRLRLAWWAVPIGAAAAGLVLGVVLHHRAAGPGEGVRTAAVASLPSVPVPKPMPSKAARPGPSMLDAAALAHVQLGVPDVTLPAPVPTVARPVGPESYTWEIPEIHPSEL